MENLKDAVKSMKRCTDVPVNDCLDVCLLIPGLGQADWDKAPMTLLAFAGYHARRDILDYLIEEGASELGELQIARNWGRWV